MWMFGSRTTVKKVSNSLTWFSHMGCLKYGACFSGLDAQDDSVLILRLKDEDLLEAPDDSAFLHSLRLSCARVKGAKVPP